MVGRCAPRSVLRLTRCAQARPLTSRRFWRPSRKLPTCSKDWTTTPNSWMPKIMRNKLRRAVSNWRESAIRKAMRASCRCWTRSARTNRHGMDMSGRWRSATWILFSSSWRWEARVRMRPHPVAIPRSYEASHRMFFEFTRGNALRTIEGSRQGIDLDERFENALRNTAMVWRQAVDRRLRRLGTSRVGWMTIAAVVQARSPLSQAALADTLAVSRASMVHTIDRLVKDGLVKRELSACDRRLKRIVGTDAGAHLYFLLRARGGAGGR